MPVWITLDVGLPKHPKIAELSSDGARFGWIVILCEAKSQRSPGSFSSERHFREVAGRFAKYLPEYLTARLLEGNEDGSLSIHDWERHQWSVRQARHRGDDSVTSALLDSDPSRAVSVPVSVSTLPEGVQGEPDAFEAFHRRTGQVPGQKLRVWLNELSGRFGEGNVATRIAAVPLDDRNPPDYLRAIGAELAVQEHRAEKAERADELRRIEEKRAPIVLRPTPIVISEEEAERIAAEYVAEFGGKHA